MQEISITCNGPYDFDRALRREAFDPLKFVDLEDRMIKVPLWLQGEPVVIDVRATGTTEDPSFLISFSDDSNKKEALSEIEKIFRWNQPLEKVGEHFSKTELAPLFQQFRGMPHIRDFSIYRSLVTCIIHQQLNLAFSYTLTKRFIEKYGTQENGVWFYPKPEITAEIPYETLQDMQFSRRKSEYLIDISKMIAEGNLDLEALEQKKDEEVLNRLVKIRGLGPWSAQNVLLFGLGRENLMPAADVGVQNGLKKLRGLDKKPAAAEIAVDAAAWAPYNSYAALYLWESLGNHSVNQ